MERIRDRNITDKKERTQKQRGTTCMETMNAVHRRVVETYLSTIDVDNPPTPDEIEADIINMLEKEFEYQKSFQDIRLTIKS